MSPLAPDDVLLAYLRFIFQQVDKSAPRLSEASSMLCDLHLHTTKSDGVWEPERLLDEVRARGLEAFSITDHDCVDAYPIPEDLRDRCISGLEIDSHHDGYTAHILAYGIGDARCELLRTLQLQRESRVVRMESMIARLQAVGIEVTMDEVRAQAKGSGSLGRPHLARALVSRGNVATVQEAFDRYLADEGDGFVALDRLTSETIIAMIHRCGGVAVVAHPMRLRKLKYLEELCELGVDGIEIAHPTADAASQNMLTSFATDRGLLMTGGTDFHAPLSGRPIGIHMSQKDVAALRSAIENRRLFHA